MRELMVGMAAALLSVQDAVRRDESPKLLFSAPSHVVSSWSLDGAIELELEHSELILRPQPQGAGDWLKLGRAEVGDTIVFRWAARYKDTIRSQDERRPLNFIRVWDTIDASLRRSGDWLIEPKDVRLESPINQCDVGYRWSNDAESYIVTARRVSGRLDSESVESLGSLLPFAAILASCDKAETQEWEVDPREFMMELWPGGFGSIDYGSRPPCWQFGGTVVPEWPPSPEVWLSNVEGSVLATLDGGSVSAGENLIAVALRVDISGTVSPQQWMAMALAESRVDRELSDTRWVDYNGKGITWSWTGSGLCFWSSSSRIPRRMAIEGDLRVRTNLDWELFPRESRTSQRNEFDEEWAGTISVRIESAE